MDKEKLIKALKYFYDNLEPDNGLVNDNDDKFETLCNEIQNGEFDKQPCGACKDWAMTTATFCPFCGKELSK